MRRARDRMAAEGPDGPSRRLHLAGEAPWLTSAKLKLVDACNLRCFMCDYWKGRRAGELDTAEVLRVLDDLRRLSCEKVHFTGGELFLRADALTLLAHAAQLGMRTNLTTNGTLLDRDRIRALVELPVRSITLSLDSPVAAVHDRVRGRPGAHKKTVRALDRLLARRTKTKVRLNTVVSAENYLSLLEMGEFLRDRPVDEWLLIPIDLKTDRRGALTEADLRRYQAEVAPALAATVRAPGFTPWVFGPPEASLAHAARQEWALGHYARHRCWVPWFHTLIDAAGDVYPCCMTHKNLPPLGNVRERPLPEIFAGDRYVAFRRGMLERREAVCHRCDDFLAENLAFAELERSWGAG